MEWHELHATSAMVWTERRMFTLPKSLLWQPRQSAITSAGFMREKACGMVVFPPRASTCALPGPWQPSQPVRSGGSLPEATLLKCGLR